MALLFPLQRIMTWLGLMESDIRCDHAKVERLDALDAP
tara:strand:- start:45035 stop:45148 length:114 start_codon:yes stop_codon:yes gene_type:complete